MWYFLPNLCLCLGLWMEDWSVLVCQPSSISWSESLEISVSSWTGMDPPLCWFGLMKGGKVFAVGWWENCRQEVQMQRTQPRLRRDRRDVLACKHVAGNKRRALILNSILQISWTCWTGLWKHKCTGQFVQLLFAAVFLVFPSILSKWRFFGLKVALRIDIHTEAGQQRPITEHSDNRSTGV